MYKDTHATRTPTPTSIHLNNGGMQYDEPGAQSWLLYSGGIQFPIDIFCPNCSILLTSFVPCCYFEYQDVYRVTGQFPEG